MWSPKLAIKDKPSKTQPDRGIYQIVYWSREDKKYKYVCIRYGYKQSKEKAYEMMEIKQKELRKLLTYDGKDRIQA
tara:strand:- start:202 stop:429 length:228 start_codon:yes stop_codon:yes gene_type:complete